MKCYLRLCTFRLDDITPDMDWDKFLRIRAIFDKYKIRPLLGIVPDNQDPGLKKGPAKEDFWGYMRSLQSQGWSIAQHGYQHIYETTDSGLLGLKNASEFAGLSPEIQLQKLRLGREILQREGLDVTIFMAPGHTFDRNTLKALKHLGFTTVTDGYADVPYYREGLLFVPSRNARPKISRGLDTICIHANEYGEQEFHELQEFLEKNRKCVHSYDEVLKQIWYPNHMVGVQIQENMNLALHQIKGKVADSKACHTYLQETYDEDSTKCKINRIKGLPKLAGAILREQKKKR